MAISLSITKQGWLGWSTRLARVVNQAGKIVGIKQLQLCDLYQQALRRKAVQIHHDSTHPLNSAFETLPSGR